MTLTLLRQVDYHTLSSCWEALDVFAALSDKAGL